jgi:hypothetical protein
VDDVVGRAGPQHQVPAGDQEQVVIAQREIVKPFGRQRVEPAGPAAPVDLPPESGLQQPLLNARPHATHSPVQRREQN